MAKYRTFYLSLLLTVAVWCFSWNAFSQDRPEDAIKTGAEQPELYLPMLADKKVGIVANQTSVVGDKHLVDILVENKISVSKVFAPEHGFRGEAGPGDHVDSGKDSKTGLPIISLYGKRKKPAKDDLEGVEVMVFDMQDVGARFYTYISTLQLVMEACAEENVPLIVLDRPNPNGFYIDGPVLDTAFSSFVGMAPIPVVHGLTIGEYAKMANGEEWLKNRACCELTVVTVTGYNHSMLYKVPVRPSPNLPDMASIYLYPSLCLFEGTMVSVGRGTDMPFKLFGFPGMDNSDTSFKPADIPGVISNPPYKDKMCNGKLLYNDVNSVVEGKHLRLDYLLQAYSDYPDKDKFFNDFFEKLAGNSTLRKQVKAGLHESEIRESWQPALENYRQKRQKYLLYPDE